MDIDKIKTIDCLEDDPEREKQLRNIRGAIEQRTMEALRLFQERFGVAGNRRDFINCLKEIWPENDDHRAKPTFFIDFEQDGELQKLNIVFDRSSEYDSNSRTIRINIDPLFPDRTSDDESKAARFEGGLKILQSVYHEVEHIYYQGSPLEPKDIEETLEYLGHPGEIRAFARQFASLYQQHYPGELFSLEKMQALAQAFGDNRAINYFISFADPSKQEKYAQYADIGRIHQTVASLTERFSNRFNLEAIVIPGRNSVVQVIGSDSLQ